MLLRERLIQEGKPRVRLFMRFCLLIGIVLTTLAAVPFVLRAENPVDSPEAKDEHGKKADHGKKDEHGKHGASGSHGDVKPFGVEEGLFKGALDLTIWTLVVFLTLVFVLRTFAWTPIREGLDKREQGIAGAMEEARTAKEEASRLRDQLQAEMAKAQDQVRQILDKARHDAETTAADLLAKGKADLQTERDRLVRDMQTSHDQALQDILVQTAQLSTSIASKVVNKALSPDDHRQLIDSALAEFRQAAEERKRDITSVRA